MITRNTTVILTAIFLVTLSSKANAKLNENYCSDSQCGYVAASKISIKPAKLKAHAVKTLKPVQVASLGNEPIGEPPRAEIGLLAKAKSYMGSNPTGWGSLWCGRFIAYIAPRAAEQLKRMGLNPNWARDYARLPGAKSYGSVGDIIVLTRGSRGGHVGIVAGFDKNQNPIVISGNHGHVVGKGVYPKSRVIAYATI